MVREGDMVSLDHKPERYALLTLSVGCENASVVEELMMYSGDL